MNSPTNSLVPTSCTELARDLRAALAGQLDPAVAERAARISRGRPSEQRLESPTQIHATGETQPT